jgi:hypothetical protein
MLDDTRKIPYLLIWKNHSDGTVKEAARIAPYYEAAGRGGPDWTGAFEIKRHDGSRDFIRTLLRTLPRNRGRVRLLIYPYCSIPRRGLYGWRPGGRFTNSVQRSTWGCRKCNGLRYASEGGALPDPSPWNAGPRIRNWSLTAPRALAPLRVHLA